MIDIETSDLQIPQFREEAKPEKWYALATCSRHEKRVARQLEGRNIGSFLPLYRSMRKWADRRKELDLPLFPGYVFVQMQLETKLRVLQIPGVVRLISFQGRPAEIQAEEIELWRTRLACAQGVEPYPYLQVGRRVRVRRGALEGLEGIISRRKGHCRVVFSIDLIMRSVAVELEENDVEPV